MKTIEKVQQTLQMQYLLESLVESYDKATKESDRYFVKMELCQAILDNFMTLEECMNYMRLQPEKFDAFISTLKSIRPEVPKPSMFKTPVEPRIKIKVFSCSKE